MPTLTTSLGNGVAVKARFWTGCSVGGSGFCGLDCGPAKFEVSVYAGGTPPGGLTNDAEPAVAAPVASASAPAGVKVVARTTGNAGASPYCSSLAPLPPYGTQSRKNVKPGERSGMPRSAESRKVSVRSDR